MAKRRHQIWKWLDTTKLGGVNPPQMFVTADDAFVALGDGTVYEAKGWQEVPAVSGAVLLQMSPP